ncbi:hypothetical protein BN135_3428 [Cronobacter muytjensii 530]
MCLFYFWMSNLLIWADNRPGFLSQYAFARSGRADVVTFLCEFYLSFYSGVLLHHDGQFTRGGESRRAQDHSGFDYPVIRFDWRE